MDYTILYYLAGIVAFLYLFGNSCYEHMTNEDVRKAHETKSEKKDPESLYEKQIKGPKAPELSKDDKDKPDPANQGGKGSGVYPEIYGPESLLVPGHKDDKSKNKRMFEESSDEPPPYDFVPAADFPKGPDAPAPFLNDFSKIMK